jgi:hypothetical protein
MGPPRQKDITHIVTVLQVVQHVRDTLVVVSK